ncbi:MAG: sugar ABC transporter permease [Chloroflexi bacterium]|jgi:raffinose/stachyose/melibiose transport system permease protein|nr:sugar ABC transporter permease [Chloroflexota bacterium]
MQAKSGRSFFVGRARWRAILGDSLFVLPAVVIFSVFFIYPVASSFYISLTKWNGLNPQLDFVGLQNFAKIWEDKHFWQALGNTFKYAFFATTIQNILGMVLALAVSHKSFRGFRVLFLIPPLLSSIALGSIWKYMFAPNGVINQLLTNFGLETWTQSWLGNPDIALYSLVATTIWRWVGMSMIIYLAGLQAIPEVIQEAASIDGANAWQRFWYITFPLIAPAFTINVVLSMIGSLKEFDLIYIMTQGGPGRATESITTFIFRQAFDFTKFGYGTAVAVVMFAIILILSLIQLTYLTRREVQL